jgi:fermentation-respiration switch protein FrsA (DUF1100 family)
MRLLSNRDPTRFDALFAALPNRIRRTIMLLSPLDAAERLRARVLIASAPHDKYFPPEQSVRFARRAARVELTITPTLEHAVPHFAFRDFAGIFRFDGFLVRVLHAAG